MEADKERLTRKIKGRTLSVIGGSGIARVQKELVENGNEKAVFTVDKVTVFSVNVTNAKVDNVSTDINLNPEVKDLDYSDN